jgi:hypothetical protein
MTPKSRDLLSRVITGDQSDRNTVACALMRYRAEGGGEVADIIQLLQLTPVARRRVSRLLAEIKANPQKGRVGVPPPAAVG